MIRNVLIFCCCFLASIRIGYANDFGGVRPDQRPCVANIVINETFNQDKVSQIFGDGKIVKTEVTPKGNKKVWWGFPGTAVVTVNGKVKLVAFMKKTGANGISLQTEKGLQIGQKSDEVLKAFGLPTYIKNDIYRKLKVTMYMYNSIGKISNFSVFNANNTIMAISFMSSDWYSL